MSRILPFETVYNFRDFGDYEGHDGRRVASKKMFRSANLNRLGGADIARFTSLDIGAIIDMRYAPERQKQPNKLPENHSAISLVFEDDPQQAPRKVAPHEAFMEQELHTGEDARNYMLTSYGRRPLDSGFIRLVKTTLEHMARSGDNILIHCAAGKDRTGTLVAIIQHILGVQKDDIFYDYMLTLEAVDISKIIDGVLPKISNKYGRTFRADMLDPMFSVREDYLKASFETMGNIDEYLANIIGLTAADMKAINSHYS